MGSVFEKRRLLVKPFCFPKLFGAITQNADENQQPKRDKERNNFNDCHKNRLKRINHLRGMGAPSSATRAADCHARYI